MECSPNVERYCENGSTCICAMNGDTCTCAFECEIGIDAKQNKYMLVVLERVHCFVDMFRSPDNYLS